MIELVSLDFETRSPVDLKAAGVHRYAAHPDTDVWCLAYDGAEGVPVLWEREEVACPVHLLNALDHGAYLRAWDASFERTIWQSILVPRYGWPALPTERFVCTMALAAAASLPLSLDKAAIALGLSQQKDREGHRLMLKMSRPRKPRKHEHATGLLWHDAPPDRARLGAYCLQDVRTETAVWDHLPPSMNARERRLWLLDQRINDRGIRLDLPLIRAAQALIAEAQPQIDARVATLTGGVTITQVAKLKDVLRARYGVDTDSLDKETLLTLLQDPTCSDEVRAILEARQHGAKSSTAKYGAMLEAVGEDGRVRGTMQYYGATTGRWAGRGIQPHNLTKPSRKITPAILRDIRGRNLPLLEALHGPILPLLADTLRSCFIAAPGGKLGVADYSTIEARVVAWLAGQQDLLEAFRSKAPLYEGFGAKVHEVDIEVLLACKRDTDEHHPWRQDGKVGILGCGFGMGFKRMSEQYGMDPELAKAIVKLYRATYPDIVQLWNRMNSAANEATLRRCEVTVEGTDGKLRFEEKGGYLLLHLPSGRPLWYHAPQVVKYWVRREEEITDPITGVVSVIDTSFEAVGVEVSTLDGVTKQWVRQRMYGGLWTENAVQAVARDIMADAMLRCENAAIPVVLSVHDELVVEAPPDLTVSRFVELLTEPPAWAAGCPIDAEGWIEERYRK